MQEIKHTGLELDDVFTEEATPQIILDSLADMTNERIVIHKTTESYNTAKKVAERKRKRREQKKSRKNNR